MTIKLTEIQIAPVRFRKGLVAFASFVLNDSFFVGDIAIYSRIDQCGYRLVYPTRVLFNGAKINAFKPIHREVADEIEGQVISHFEKLIEKGKRTERLMQDDRLSETD